MFIGVVATGSISAVAGFMVSLAGFAGWRFIAATDPALTLAPPHRAMADTLSTSRWARLPE